LSYTSELDRNSQEAHRLQAENEELQTELQEVREDIDYGKQRENKLMFFLFILKEMGYPISDVF